MKDTRTVRRRLVPRLDAERRWRQLDQRLLELGVASALGEASAITHSPLPDKEVSEERRSVCPGLPPPASRGADHPPAKRPLARRRPRQRLDDHA
jgi:hypothetical protein